MGDPRTTLVTFPLNLGIDNVSLDEAVQPVGQRPRLLASVNTRLSKVPGCAAKAPGSSTLTSSLTGPVGGVVPAGLADTSLVPARAPQRVSGSGLGLLSSVSDAAVAQNGHYPAQVTSAGAVPGSNRSRYNASCAYDATNGYTYFVTMCALATQTGVYLNVLADDGREVIESKLLVTLAADAGDERNYASVTVHGTNAVLWYGAAASASLIARTVTVNETDLTVTLGSPVTIHSPVGTILGPQQIQIATDETDTAIAVLAIQDAATSTSINVKRIAVPALTTSTTQIIAVGGYDWVGLAYKSGVAVLLATSRVGGQANLYELNPTTLASSWSNTGTMDDGVPSCGFETSSGTTYRVFAVSRIESPNDGTLVQWRASNGALGFEGAIKHQTMVGQIATIRHEDDTFSAYLTTQACYAPYEPILSYDVDDDAFLPDASIEVFRFVVETQPTGGSTIWPYCVARLGTDMAIRYPGSLNPEDAASAPNTQFIASSSSVIDVGRSLVLTYLEESAIEGSVTNGYVVRFAKLSCEALQPRFAHTADGATVIAGALTAVWDGSALTEFSPMRVPKLLGVATGGTGSLPAGTYQFATVVSWRDSQGQIHQSPPSAVLTLTNGGSAVEPILTVYLHESYRNFVSLPGFQVVIYVSETDALTPYATESWQLVAGSVSFTDETFDVDDVLEAVVDGFHPAIYTDGSETQELAAYCPNASLDVAVVADRLWLLDAERPSRWWHSKPQKPGVFFEMSPDLYIETPSSAGRGVALSEWSGNPLFLTTRGVWTVSGEGPDALLNPPFFSSATQVSDVACTQRLSVVRSPVGVLFVSNNRFVRFSGQMAEYPEINADLYGAVVGTAVFRDQQEVVFFCSDGHAYVFNWIADAWTVWDTNVTGLTGYTVTGAAQRSDGKVLLVGTLDGESRVTLLDPESVSTSAHIQLETGWLSLGGPQDDNTVHDLILHARRQGSHGVTMGVSTDYEETDEPRVWGPSSVLACVGDGTTAKRYDLFPQVARQTARSLKVEIYETDATGEAFQPINMTIAMVKHPGRKAQSMREAARR